ncbi:nucleoside phosphatase family-domain-containing protein [Mycena galopus ATCC 62051]|nr:nucleoside phosphatase family-domain-containing protein [Mycena galopus ATCC 62051]
MDSKSPTYDRLEAGTPSRPSSPPLKNGKRFGSGFGLGWALGGGALFLLVCVFVQRQQCVSLDGLGWQGRWLPENTPSTAKLSETATGKLVPSSWAEDPPPRAPGLGSDDAVDLPPKPPTTVHPFSFESDPNPASTTYCTTAFSPSSPIVQYAVVLHASFLGSRIHIYKFNNCARTPALEWEASLQTTQDRWVGNYPGRPTEGADSLRPLLDKAVRVVPRELVGCTRVMVRATSMMRVIGEPKAQAILGAVRGLFAEGGKYPFVLQEGEEGVRILALGETDEAAFDWVTANFRLGALEPPPSSSSDSLASSTVMQEEHDQTYAVLDHGGWITRIVFAPSLFSLSMLPSQAHYELDLAGTTRMLYQRPYYGWGLMSARQRVHRVVGALAAPQGNKTWVETEHEVIPNPCLARGTEGVVVEIPATSFSSNAASAHKKESLRNVTMTGASIGSFDACRHIVELTLKKDIGEVHLPAIGELFPEGAGKGRGRVLLLSNFYDRVKLLLHPAAGSRLPGQNKGSGERGLGGEGQLIATVDTFAELAKTVCAGTEAWLERWGMDVRVLRELEPESCLDLVWMWGLLRIGYQFAGDREVMLEKRFPEGTWCLGAGVKLVSGSDVQCREI